MLREGKRFQVVLMAGGQGTRLRPLTSNQPKPMVPVANKPLMEYTIEHLKRLGLLDIVVTLQFLPTVIANYFGDGTAFGVNMTYVTEESPKGTAGSVRNARSFLDRTFIVVSGDALTDIDLLEAATFHQEKGAAVTIVLKQVDNPLEFGIVITDSTGRITRFLEKPGWSEVFSDTINTGIYVIEPEILSYIPDDRPYDFSQDLFPRLLEEGFPMFGYVTEGYWCDIGNLEQYLSAHRDILDGKVNINLPGHKLGNNVWVGDGTEISDSAIVKGPVILGNHVKVEGMTKLREYSCVGDNVIIKNDNFIHRSVIMDNTYIGPACHVRGAIVGRNCDVKAGVRIDEGTVIGDDCLIGENAIINQGVMIFPFKTVDARATVNSSIIWESRGMRSLFGKRGVSGLINVDITPEMAVRLGMSYGSSLPVNSQVVTSRDGTRSARIIKRALMSGLNASGVHIRDLEVSAVPVNRFTVDSHSDQGGVDVRTSDRDPQWIDIIFFDDEGMDIDHSLRRKIERIYSRNDFRRAFLDELGEIYYPARAREAYVQALTERLDVERIRERKFKVVFDYGYGAASLILPGILGKLNCEVLSLNAYTDEKRLITSRPTLEESLRRLSEVVRSFKADLGLLLDNSAERLALVDNLGNPITESKLLAVMVDLVTARYRKGKIAVPVNQPNVIEKISTDRGFSVLWTKLSRSALMKAGREEGVVFCGGGEGDFVFPEFMSACDAIFAFAKILELLAHREADLSKIVGSIPAFHIARKTVVISWENKAQVMRQFIEENINEGAITTEGLKFILDDERWALMLPDEEEPVIHLYVEAGSTAECEELLKEYEERISKVKVR